jgi:alpha-galactosidase
MVPYVHRFWTSDNIDAVSRVAMQRGFLAFLPPELMGSHVGASPAHATGRSQALAFRAAVASAGHFGVELDPDALGRDDRAALAQWIAFAQSTRDIVHGGGVWLGEGGDGLVWQAQGSLAHGMLIQVIQVAPPQDRRPRPLPLPFLAGHGALSVRLLGIAGGLAGHAAPVPALWAAQASMVFEADWLARAGLPLPPLRAQSVAVFHVAGVGHAAADRLAPFPS